MNHRLWQLVEDCTRSRQVNRGWQNGAIVSSVAACRSPVATLNACAILLQLTLCALEDHLAKTGCVGGNVEFERWWYCCSVVCWHPNDEFRHVVGVIADIKDTLVLANQEIGVVMIREIWKCKSLVHHPYKSIRCKADLIADIGTDRREVMRATYDIIAIQICETLFF